MSIGQESTHSVRYCAHSDKGLIRSGNEDAFLVGQVGIDKELADFSTAWTECAGCGLVFVVSDGVGGLNAGEVASKMVVEGVLRELATRLPGEYSEIPDAKMREEILNESVISINQQVRRVADESAEKANMAATLTLLWLVPGGITIGQVGDSRCYRSRDWELEQLTEDQSKVAAMVRRGELSEEEAHHHPQKNIIEQAVGVEPDKFSPVFHSRELKQGDRFLLCSDGLTDGLDRRDLTEFFSEPFPDDLAKHTRELITFSMRASGKDNLTAILVEYGRAPAAALVRILPASLRGYGAKVARTLSEFSRKGRFTFLILHRQSR